MRACASTLSVSISIETSAESKIRIRSLHSGTRNKIACDVSTASLSSERFTVSCPHEGRAMYLVVNRCI